MPKLSFTQPIFQLEKRKGGYYYLKIEASTVNKFKKGKSTRLKCDIDNELSLSCGLNHLGDGNFYIIVATRHMKKLKKKAGDEVYFEIYEDANPLGVEIPEVLEALLAQDDQLKSQYNDMTDGRKRTLIYTITSVKNVDLQIEKALKFFEEDRMKIIRKNKR